MDDIALTQTLADCIALLDKLHRKETCILGPECPVRGMIHRLRGHLHAITLRREDECASRLTAKREDAINANALH